MSFFGLGGGQSTHQLFKVFDHCLTALLSDAQPAGAINPAQVSDAEILVTLSERSSPFPSFQIEMAVAELDMITDVL